MIDVVIARALHVLAVVHWIGGVTMVTLVILPALRTLEPVSERLATFEHLEGRFARQARMSVTLAGVTGFYLVARLEAWWRFLEPGYWWMHAMVLVWLLFTFVLFLAEPLFLHGWIHRQASVAPMPTFALVEHAHRLALLLAMVTTAGAVLGAHGLLY